MEQMTAGLGLLTEAGHLSELTVNRQLQGELSGDEKTIFDTHLASCLACRQFVDRLEAFDDTWRTAHAWPADRPLDAPAPPPSPDRARPNRAPSRTPRWLAPTAGLMALAAALALVFWFWGDAAPTTATLDGDRINIKGGSFGLAIYADRGQGAQRLSTGQTVHPGDKLGFRVHSDEAGHLMIAGIDDMGQIYLCHPQPPHTDAALLPPSPQGRTLDAAIELDDLLGQERIVAIMCPKSFSYSKIRAALTEHRTQKTLPALLEGCAQREIALTKTPRPGFP